MKTTASIETTIIPIAVIKYKIHTFPLTFTISCKIDGSMKQKFGTHIKTKIS